MIDTYSLWTVVICVAVTLLTRFLPFLVFGGGRTLPAAVSRLGKVLPCALMGMLVVYCLKDTAWLAPPYGIPEVLGCAAVVLLHLWKRNSLLSIGGGTALYMALLHWVF